MGNERKDKDKIVKSAKKMVANKNLVRSYIKGKTSIRTISKKGIKFAKPL